MDITIFSPYAYFYVYIPTNKFAGNRHGWVIVAYSPSTTD